MDTSQLLIAVAAVIGAVAGLINSLAVAVTLLQARKNGVVASETRRAVERVELNTNGHMEVLVSLIKAVDPEIAALAAAKVLKTAEDAAKPP